MKKLLLVILIISGVFSICAQTKNVNVDNYRFDVVVRTFPAKPWNPLFFNYSVAINASAIVQKNISIGEVYDAVNIEAQRKVQDFNQAALILQLNLGSIVINSSKVVDDIKTKKNKDGSVTETHEYYMEVNYNFSSSYEIKSTGKTLSKGEPYSNLSSRKYSTERYKTSKDASDFWNNNREMIIANLYRDLCLTSAAQLSSTATSLYGFPVIKSFVLLKTIDEKKHNENEAFRKNVELLKSALQAMTPEIPMDRKQADALIKYFKSIPERYADPKSKADARLRYAAYYNLCRIYLYLDEPDNVYKYADLILANGEDTKDSERLRDDANDLKTALNKTAIKTRHFNPDDYN